MGQAKTICMVMFFLCLVAHFNMSLCETYTVGDEKGWDYDSSPWPLNKNFKAGDVLDLTNMLKALFRTVRDHYTSALGQVALFPSWDGSHPVLDGPFCGSSPLGLFNYKPVEHNVVVVNEQGYHDCSVPPGSPTFITGKDSITLAKNYNYFISSIGQDCQNGMQLMVFAN